MVCQKKLIIILVVLLVIIFFLLSCQKQPFPKSKEVEAKILLAMDKFKESNNEEGFKLILEAVLLTTPNTDLPNEVETKIFKAKDHFNSTDYLNEEGSKLLWDAYKLIKPGLDKPDEPSGMGSIAEVFKNKLLEAQDELKKDNPDKVVGLLLEAILITRPLNSIEH